MEQFLQEKARNFKAFLLEQDPDETLLNQIELFNAELLVVTLYAVLAREQEAISELLSHCKPKDEKAVRTKMERYMACFRECLKL